jgi:predicted AAA+ superfamily ATPase
LERFIDHYLDTWRMQEDRKPLLLRGARQVGKTYAARNLGKQFDNCVELNLEFKQEMRNLFSKDLDPHRIIRDISLLTGERIIPGKTLLFFDEIQAEPLALQALRYFYEMMPELHVIAAGSLLDFAIEMVGMPVGRVESYYVYPLSFLEFINALEEKVLLETLLEHNVSQQIPAIAHTRLLTLIGQYLALGGMPEVVQSWIKHKDPQRCFVIQQTLISAYRQDFGKYAKKHQIKYVDLLFDAIPLQLGGKFKYSALEGEFRKRELAPCVDLLTTAHVIHKVTHTDAQGLPLGAQADPTDFKIIFLDIALAQAVLGLDVAEWFIDPEQQYINQRSIVEAFVGQELLAYSNLMQKKSLYYWQRKERNSQAEIDYVVHIEKDIVPIEVKSGHGSTLKSMHMFLQTHQKSNYGIRFSAQNYSTFEAVHSYPLYDVARAVKSSAPKVLKIEHAKR